MLKVVYLPKARQDISDIVHYIAHNLHAPKAAGDLLDAMEAAILRAAEFPRMYKVYSPTQSLPRPYRMIPVRNYAVFYVELDDAIEVRRVLYARRNLNAIELTDKK